MVFLHLRAYSKFLLVYFLICNGILIGQEQEDKKFDETIEEILIFRTSPGIELEAEGFFKFQVSTFSPILVVKVNGFAQMVTIDKDWAEFEIPFYLDREKNLFTVFVQTKTSQKEKQFIVNYKPKKKKVKVNIA